MGSEEGGVGDGAIDGEVGGAEGDGAVEVDDGGEGSAEDADLVAGFGGAGGDAVGEGDVGEFGGGVEEAGGFDDFWTSLEVGGVAVVVEVESGRGGAVAAADVGPVPEVAGDGFGKEGGVADDAAGDFFESLFLEFFDPGAEVAHGEGGVAAPFDDDVAGEGAVVVDGGGGAELGGEGEVGSEDLEGGGGGDGFESGGGDEGEFGVVAGDDVAFVIEKAEADEGVPEFGIFLKVTEDFADGGQSGSGWWCLGVEEGTEGEGGEGEEGDGGGFGHWLRRYR